jgi:hypothetical protein
MSLREHVRAFHPRITPLPRSNRDVVREHRHEHHQLTTDHKHAGKNDGPNIGPGRRPAGWTSGADVVLHQRTKERLVATTGVTLDGRPARIVGVLLDFPTVIAVGDPPLAVEFSWVTVARIVAKHQGQFQSH